MVDADVEDALRDTLVEDAKRSSPSHHFHPSQITGCPLKVLLNEMTDHETTLNSWLFQGSAVHYYLQETGILDEVFDRAGYHPVRTRYEQNIKYPLEADVWINGTCDILVENEEERVIYDIKYSSIPVESDHPRLYKYFSQANTYAKMFNADRYGLIMINSKSQNLVEDVHVIPGELSEENWEIVTSKARAIKKGLDDAEYDAGNRWEPEWLREKRVEFWKGVTQYFNNSHIPSYSGECDYCSHSDYCPETNGMLGGVNEIIEDSRG